MDPTTDNPAADAAAAPLDGQAAAGYTDESQATTAPPGAAGADEADGRGKSPLADQGTAGSVDADDDRRAEGDGAARTGARDPDRVAYERLAAGESPRAIQQTTAKDVAPSPDARTTPDRAAGAAAKAANPAYEGLAAEDAQALKRTSLLPSKPEAWAAMPPETRANLIANAKRTLSDRGRYAQQLGQFRAFQAGQQVAQQQSTPQPPAYPPGGDGPFPTPAAPGSGATYAPSGANAGGQLAWSPQQQQQPIPPQTQPYGYGQLPPPAGSMVDTGQRPPGGQPAQPQPTSAYVQQLRDYVGDDVADAYVAEQQHAAQALANSQAQYQQLAAQQEALLQEWLAPQEAKAWSAIGQQIGRPLSPEEQRDLRAIGKVHFNAARSGNEPIDWGDALRRAAGGVFNVDHRQQAQLELSRLQQQSLRGSPARPRVGANARTQARPSSEDRMADAYERLQQGEAPVAVNRAVYAAL